MCFGGVLFIAPRQFASCITRQLAQYFVRQRFHLRMIEAPATRSAPGAIYLGTDMDFLAIVGVRALYLFLQSFVVKRDLIRVQMDKVLLTSILHPSLFNEYVAVRPIGAIAISKFELPDANVQNF